MNYFKLIIITIFIAGCAPLDSVIITDVKDEYVIVGRDTTPFVSQQHIAEENATSGAVEFCKNLGKEYKKRYVVTTGMMPGHWADATLHFRCLDKNSVQLEQSQDPPKNIDDITSNRKNISEDQLYSKLTNLKKLLDDGIITKDEFEQQKTKILNQK